MYDKCDLLQISLLSSPWTYFLPLFIHRCVRVFFCLKQCCNSSALICFKVFAVFIFTCWTDWKFLPLNSFSLLKISKNYMVWDLGNAVDAQAQECACSLKTALWIGHCELMLDPWIALPLLLFLHALYLSLINISL